MHAFWGRVWQVILTSWYLFYQLLCSTRQVNGSVFYRTPSAQLPEYCPADITSVSLVSWNIRFISRTWPLDRIFPVLIFDDLKIDKLQDILIILISPPWTTIQHIVCFQHDKALRHAHIYLSVGSKTSIPPTSLPRHALQPSRTLNKFLNIFSGHEVFVFDVCWFSETLTKIREPEDWRQL